MGEETNIVEYIEVNNDNLEQSYQELIQYSKNQQNLILDMKMYAQAGIYITSAMFILILILIFARSFSKVN